MTTLNPQAIKQQPIKGCPCCTYMTSRQHSKLMLAGFFHNQVRQLMQSRGRKQPLPSCTRADLMLPALLNCKLLKKLKEIAWVLLGCKFLALVADESQTPMPLFVLVSHQSTKLAFNQLDRLCGLCLSNILFVGILSCPCYSKVRQDAR